jgi:hypothetical protein
MNIFKKSFVILAMLFTMLGFSSFAQASEVDTTQVVSHIEKALVEVGKSDFSAAQVHLKAARAAADAITGNPAGAQEARNALIQGQIQAKKGDVSHATAQLNQAIELYKKL